MFAASSVPRIIAAAPSFKPEEFPAVTEPPSFLNAALNDPSFSNEVAGFMNSSFSNTISSFFRCGKITLQISSSNRPFSVAVVAFI